MALRDRLKGAIQALAGVSAYSTPPIVSMGLDSPSVEKTRESLGGQLQMLPASKLRWFITDLEDAQYFADAGDMSAIARLARTMRRDGVISGLLKTRTAGLVALPKRFRGDAKAVAMLEEQGQTRPLFDEMFPPEALAPFLADYIVCGVAVAELLPVKGRKHPVMVRRDPEFLRYRWNEDRWYFNSIAGQLPIFPGDGRWMLLTADRMAPWNCGCWPALGRAYIAKEHAMLARANFSRKLANPAIIGYSPPAATDADTTSWVEKLVAWGLNTVFQVPTGWDVKLLETNGRGWEVFGTEIETANLEIMITLAGSKVLVDGGTGFANAGIHAGIRADLIQETGAALAHCINTQGIPPWEIEEFGIEVLKDSARVEWDVAPAADRKAEAEGLKAVAEAITALKAAISGDETAKGAINVPALLSRYGVPVDESVPVPEPVAPPEVGEDAPEAPKESDDDNSQV